MTFEDFDDEVDALQIRTAAYEAVAMGDAEIVGERDGESVFKLTDAGRARAEEIIDAAIKTHGAYAPEALAEALDVPIEVGEKLVELRNTPK